MESYQKRKGEYLEAKKNGTFHAEEGFHNMAPVPLPEELGGNGHQGSGIDYDDEDDDASVPAKRYSDSSEKKKRKRKRIRKTKMLQPLYQPFHPIFLYKGFIDLLKYHFDSEKKKNFFFF
ncbi:Hmo1p SCDLUD_001846 [Saccharomycodes ludwigii]|uniref:Hmo1p n=1 Tax=Saccharomycodes ludwigii TaxID=36035 RepID=UPI001E87568C|nr:hypothetical protein SCDLUD_001846 [Saccharomycodes ludwigii]KAH3902035.1 hypothetical protein SCDLUD_001846 [Saccharomycodes ludwigii]